MFKSREIKSVKRKSSVEEKTTRNCQNILLKTHTVTDSPLISVFNVLK